jgi:hypothetical protein
LPSRGVKPGRGRLSVLASASTCNTQHMHMKASGWAALWWPRPGQAVLHTHTMAWPAGSHVCKALSKRGSEDLTLKPQLSRQAV